MTGIPHQIEIETVPEEDVSRRSFLQQGSACVAGGLLLPSLEELLTFRQVQKKGVDRLWGVAMAYCQGRLDLIDLDGNRLLHSFEGIRATHAITPIESLNRFVIHGHRQHSNKGVVVVFQVDPVNKTWEVILNEDLPGGPALHWQPNPEFTQIVFNTVGDGGLHVLDTKELTIKRYNGGGRHSKMAFFENYLVATDKMSGPTNLNIVDRNTGKLVSQTAVGNWGHGVTVNDQRGEAFVWSTDGVHVISLAQGTMGKRLRLMETENTDERSWFCWTPQGGRYSHDVSWNPGDEYRPYLLVVDMLKGKFERISTGDPGLQPSYLQLSPDGKWGLASLRGLEEIAIFDTEANEYKGLVSAGPAKASFFERDMTFCRQRDCAIVTNTGDNTISLLDLKQKQEVRRISLPRQPLWLKAISPA